jgi:salicylate 5-hydroxylase large subunit
MGRHAVMISRRNEGGANAAVTEGLSFKANMLQDDRLLDVVPRAVVDGGRPGPPRHGYHPTVTMITLMLFPSLIIQQQVNSLTPAFTSRCRAAPGGEFDFVWTHFWL